MKKNIFLLVVLLSFIVSSSATLSAGHLDGLWRNDRQNITIRIEQNSEGFRAKRTDQGIWYNYTFDDEVYIDKRGNWYEVINEDQLEWNDAVLRKRVLFHRVDSRQDDSRADRNRNEDWDTDNTRTGRNRDDDWDTDSDHRDRDQVDRRTATVAGRWYNRSSKERLIIEETNNGYRVRTLHGSWQKFTADRNGQRLRSRSGDVIQMIDRNRLRWRSEQGNWERLFVRQGNGQPNGIEYHKETHSNKEKHGNKEKHRNSGKKGCE